MCFDGDRDSGTSKILDKTFQSADFLVNNAVFIIDARSRVFSAVRESFADRKVREQVSRERTQDFRKKQRDLNCCLESAEKHL